LRKRKIYRGSQEVQRVRVSGNLGVRFTVTFERMRTITQIEIRQYY